MLSIKFYGVRGSISVSGDEYREFGGNTTCIQIMASDTKKVGGIVVMIRQLKLLHWLM